MPRSWRTSSLKPITILAHLGALLTMIAWGSSFLSSKVLMIDGGFTPVEVFVYRFAFAYVLLLLFTFKKIFANSWKDELQLLACGLCAGSLYFITENYALKLTSAGNVSLLASISPLFTTALMTIIYKVKVNLGVIIGSVVAFFGVGCVIFSSGDGFELRPTGDIFALCSALSWAIYSIVVKRLNPLYSSFFITRKMFFYGVLTALPLFFIQKAPYHFNLLFDFNNVSLGLNFLFLVVMCSLLAYLIWSEIMKILGPITTNNYLYLQPLVTMFAAYLFLGEGINTWGLIGCFLIILGILLSDKLKLQK